MEISMKMRLRGNVMNIRELIQNKRIFSFHLNEELKIEAISYNLFSSGGKYLINENIEIVLRNLFCNDIFHNEEYVNFLLNSLRTSVSTKQSSVEQIVLSDQNLNAQFYYSFSLGIDIIMVDSLKIVLKFNNFEENISKESFYSKLLVDIEDEFDVFSRTQKIGRFVIDYSKEMPIVFADQNFPELFGLKKSESNNYQLPTIENKELHTVIKHEYFNRGISLLKKNELIYFNEECLIKNKWIKCDMKVTKKDDNGECLLITGVIYDISDSNKHKDIKNLYSIYELAITSGDIGIFHFNLDNHTMKYFDCNIIYKRMLGLDQKENGLYLVDDFKNCLLPLEDEISDKNSALKSLSDLLQGSIEGSNEDILKIRNPKTDEIKYLLSSSKINVRYADGTPKIFGGIVIDITSRITKEKRQIAFAYVDELTRLSNNRKLFKDLKNKTSGIGLFFDLDSFKQINDKYGHLFGDKILRIYGDCLLEISNKYINVTPYRLYGDEFFVFGEGYSEEFAKPFHKELNDLVTKKVNILKPGIIIAASMGYSILDTAVDLDEFVKTADYSMYKEKIKRRKVQI